MAATKLKPDVSQVLKERMLEQGYAIRTVAGFDGFADHPKSFGRID